MGGACVSDGFYHQDERDRAATMGCFAVAAIILGGVLIALSAALLG